MIDRCETFRDCRTTILLSLRKRSNLYTIPCGFYGSANAQNRMCELCMFSQIWSHIFILANNAIHQHNVFLLTSLFQVS